MQIKGLPENDGRLWLIKWIDEFRIPHLGTRSPSVHVLCQRLAHEDFESLSQLTIKKIQEILGIASQDAAGWHRFPVLVGYIPYLSIGMVFQDQKYVGQLPVVFDTIELSDAESPSHSLSLAEEMNPPDEWPPQFPYRIINRSEFSGIMTYGFSRSRFVWQEIDHTLYIIPRSVIFRCFYGPNSAIANAFCKGPWQEASHEVIYYWPLESGLETRLNHEEKTWDIILQPKIDSQYAPLLAAQIFDPYAKSCAESIYTNIIRERGAKNNEPWFAAAKIPFDTSQESLRLRIKGFYLKTLGKGPRKFLVTGITEADFPRYFPKIRWEKANSGEQGANITPVDEPAPYQNGTRIRPAPAGIVGFSDEDFAVEEGALLVPADDFAWAQAPTMEKLVKQSSKQYNAPEAHRFFQPTLENVSSGSATHRKSGLAEAQVETAIRRDRSQQFMNLLESFDALQASDVIERWSIFGPTDRAMLASRHGLPCWNFLDEDARVTGKWPRRSWRLLDPAPKDKDGAIGVPRCALVIQISMENITGFWIEIEVRPNGAEGFLSPFVVTQENPHEMMAHFIELIARLSGVQLAEKLPREAKKLKGTTVRCYKHRYESQFEPSLNRPSLANFFRKNSLAT